MYCSNKRKKMNKEKKPSKNTEFFWFVCYQTIVWDGVIRITESFLHQDVSKKCLSASNTKKSTSFILGGFLYVGNR